MMDYKHIFNERGEMYHKAMVQYPSVREDEFLNLFEFYKIDESDVVADFPSGGCYLKKYIRSNEMYFLDPSEELLNKCEHKHNIIKCALENTPIKNSFFDKVFSLAGTHHNNRKDKIFEEVNRILSLGGNFIYADVMENSKEALFLDVFVNKFNSLGHKGFFLTEDIKIKLERCGFRVDSFEYITLTWRFHNLIEMANFTKMLFGLDLATDEKTVINGLGKYLGYKKNNGIIELNWGLLYIFSEKISAHA